MRRPRRYRRPGGHDSADVWALKLRQHRAHGTGLAALVFTGTADALTYAQKDSVELKKEVDLHAIPTRESCIISYERDVWDVCPEPLLRYHRKTSYPLSAPRKDRDKCTCGDKGRILLPL